MKKIENIRELQEINIILLKELYNVCNKNNINIYLLGGTLLGAVRHKGFIPWDDDIDISISRKNYIKLVEVLKNEVAKDFELINPETNQEFRGYIPLFVYKKSKMLSKQYREKEELKIGVSIFVFDGIPKNRLMQWFYLKKMYFLRSCHALCRADFNHVNTKIAKKMGPILQPFFSSKSVYKYKNRILKAQKQYSYDISEYLAPNTDAGAKKEIVLKNVYEENCEIIFENINCLVSKNYLEHLEKYYGNFMELPPIEERAPKHSFSMWVDEEIFKKEIK